MKEKMQLDIKWATRQRLQYIEVLAYYAGLVTRSDVARAFGMSDPAATKDLKLYNDLAPGNLAYAQAVFGFVPSADFSPVFSSLEPTDVLPMVAANLTTTGGPYGSAQIYGLQAAHLPLPERFPDRRILAQITRAMRGGKKLRARYRSLSGQGSDAPRLIEPHTLVNTGLRWHVRAYSEDHYEFRDFVLSRFVAAECLSETAESSAEYDEDWVETLVLKLAPHAKLAPEKQASLLLDYGTADVLQIETRRALVGYLLQQLGVDTSIDHDLNPEVYQLMLLNRDEVEPYAAWALD